MPVLFQLLTGLAIAKLTEAGGAPPPWAIPYGIQHDFPLSDIPGTWTTHYDEPYNHGTTQASVSPPSGDCMMIGSKASSAATTLSLALFMERSCALAFAGTENYAGWENGGYWYMKTGSSVGFAPNENIRLSSADTTSSEASERLSWHFGGSGGYRSGSTTSLNSNTVWRKVIMYGPCTKLGVCGNCQFGSDTYPCTTSTTSTTTVTTTTLTVTTTTAPPDVMEIPYGIQHDFPLSWIPSTWSMFYNQSYGHGTSVADVSPPDGDCMVIGSKTHEGASTLSLALFMERSCALSFAGTAGYAGWENGGYWYFHTSKSVGFAPTTSLSLNSADTSSTGGADRLSWHVGVSGSSAGYRSGNSKSLNAPWRKIIMTGPCTKKGFCGNCQRGGGGATCTSTTPETSTQTTVTTTTSTTTATVTITTTTATVSTTSTTTASSSSSSSSSSTSSSSSSSSTTSSTTSSSTTSSSSTTTTTTTVSSTSSSSSTSTSSSSSSSTSSVTSSSSSSSSSSTTTTSTTTTSASSTSSTTSTTTVTAGPLADEAKNLLAKADEAKAQTLNLLASGEKSVSVALPGVGTLFASKVDLTSGEDQSFEIPGTDIKMDMPATLFETFPEPPVPGDEPVLAAVSVDGGTARRLGSSAALALDFNWLSGPKIEVDGLSEPVSFTLPVIYNNTQQRCLYFDEETQSWSDKGVRVSPLAKLGEPLLCETFHFSLFGAIWEGMVQTLLCANFDLFTAENIARIFEGTWYKTLGAGCVFIVVSLLMVGFVAAAFVDKHREGRYRWSDEFFLVPTPEPVPAIADDEDEGDVDHDESEPPVQSKRSIAQRVGSAIAGGCRSCYDTICGCDALKEALDDICESWFAFFGQVRGFLENVCGGVGSLMHSGTGVCNGLSHKITTQLLMLTSRRTAAATLYMSGDLINFVLDDKDLGDYLTEERERMSADEARTRATRDSSRHAGDWRSYNEQYYVWHSLRQEICEVLIKRTRGQTSRKRIMMRLISNSFLFQNPIGDLYVIDVFRSCKAKAVCLSSDLLGAFVLCAFFFQGSGMVSGKDKDPMCDSEEEGSIGNKIGRFIVIATGSLVIAGLPVTILESLQTKGFKRVPGERGSKVWKRQLLAWKIQEVLFWIFAAAYNFTCVLYLLTFVANISPEDHWDWTFAGLLSLFEDFLAAPLLMASVIPIMARVWLCVHSRMNNVSQEEMVRRACVMLHESTNMLLPIESV